MERLTFAPVKGFMKGFMDMVFWHNGRCFLVDWKSNYLGDRPQDYGPEGLAEIMAADHYFLQYHLYVVALDQFLRLKLDAYDYTRHFGGVFYIFLRGINRLKGRSCGIFFDYPDVRLIRDLRKALMPQTIV